MGDNFPLCLFNIPDQGQSLVFDVSKEMSYLDLLNLKTEPGDSQQNLDEERTKENLSDSSNVLENVIVSNIRGKVNFGSKIISKPRQSRSATNQKKINRRRQVVCVGKSKKAEKEKITRETSSKSSKTSKQAKDKPNNMIKITKKIIKKNTRKETFRCETGANKTDKQTKAHKRKKSLGKAFVRESEATFTCKTCDKVYKILRCYKLHLKICGREMKPALCPDCGKAYINKYNMHVHRKKHRNPQPFTCHLCKSQFTEKCALARHLLRHAGVNRVFCPDCGRGFPEKCALYNHAKSHIPVEARKKFVCDICMKQVHSQKALTYHMTTHSGIKPFECHHCSNLFSNKCLLRSHIRRHMDVKPYACKLCPRSFKQLRSLKYHMDQHAGIKRYKCPECDMTFVRPLSLIRHKRTHTGEKPYKCTVCGFCMADPSAFLKHKKLHADSAVATKGYRCNICPLVCKTKASYYKHRYVHGYKRIGSLSRAQRLDRKERSPSPDFIQPDGNKNVESGGKSQIVSEQSYLHRDSESMEDKESDFDYNENEKIPSVTETRCGRRVKPPELLIYKDNCDKKEKRKRKSPVEREMQFSKSRRKENEKSTFPIVLRVPIFKASKPKKVTKINKNKNKSSLAQSNASKKKKTIMPPIRVVHQCFVCGKITPTSATLKAHMLLHPANEIVKCKICKIEVLGLTQFKEHMADHRK